MAFKEKMLLTGVKRFNDVVDGTRYDNTKVFIQVDLDDSKGNAFGQASTEFQFGTSENYDLVFRALKAAQEVGAPCWAEVEIKQVTSGKQLKTVISSLVPVGLKKTA